MDISNQNKSNFVVMLARNKALKNQEMSDRQKTMSSGLAREPIEGCLILNPSKLQIMQKESREKFHDPNEKTRGKKFESNISKSRANRDKSGSKESDHEGRTRPGIQQINLTQERSNEDGSQDKKMTSAKLSIATASKFNSTLRHETSDISQRPQGDRASDVDQMLPLSRGQQDLSSRDQ